MRLKDKVTIVTGAASGFGEGIARLYADEGAKVAVADINAAGAKSVATSIGANAIAVTCDVTKRADIDALVEATREAFGGRIDVVVNNAGWTHRNRPLLEVDEATFDKVYAINVKSIFHMIHAIVPLMRQQKSGVILNVGSTAGIRPRPGLTWYNSSKGAVNLMSKSLAVELGPDNIRVNAICPVIGETGLLEEFMGMPDTPENRKKFLATIPLGRMSRPLDVARAALAARGYAVFAAASAYEALEIAKESDFDVLVTDVLTMDTVVDGAFTDFRRMVRYLGLFAGIALLLAAVGLYGALAYHVSQQEHEIGVRLAMGARRGGVLGLVLRRGGWLVAGGLLAGVAAAYPGTKLVRSLLFETVPLDPATYAGAVLLLGLVAAAACLVPALRATRVDPAVVLRSE